MPQLLGPDGLPISVADQDLLDERSAATLTGVRHPWSDYPSRGLTPSRLTRLLEEADRGDAVAYLELAEEIEEKDLHYAAVLGVRKRAVAQLEITVEPASDDAADIDIAAEIERDVFGRDEFQDELIDILDALAKGFSVCEIIWRTSASQWRPNQIVHRDPRWFRWDNETGRMLLLRDDEGDIPLPPGKFITHLAKAKSGLPIRGGLARGAAWFWMFRNYTLKDWLIFLERFAMPLRLGKYPSSASDEEKKRLFRALREIGSDAAAAIPESMEIEFIESKIAGNVEAHERFNRWAEAQLSKYILGQTETTDATRGGYATASVHERVKKDICASDSRQIAATLTRDLIRPFVDFNYGPREAYPRCRLIIPEAGDVEAMSKALAPLIDRGLRIDANEVRKRMGFNRPADDAELLAPAGAAPAAEPPEETQSAAAVQTAAAAVDDDDGVDVMLKDALEDWRPLMDGAVSPIQDLARRIDEGGGSDREKLEAFRDGVAGVVNDMDVSAVEALLEQAMFAGRLAGETDFPLRDDEAS